MSSEPYYKAHWRQIDSDRMSAYRSGFGWDQNTEKLYEPAAIEPDQQVVDFGCGPGKVAVELAKRVGIKGHVHAIDINSEFLKIARDNAELERVSDRLSTHLNDGMTLPIADGSVDRVTARNAIMYVDDPAATLKEFHRVLRPGGIAHAIDGDWYMMVAEPVEHDAWRAFVKAASYACRNSDMGRKLHGAFVHAGFQDIQVSVVANADLNGRLLGMVRNMAKYAIESGMLDRGAINGVVSTVEGALKTGNYLVVSPQFVVTGRKSA